MRSPKGRIVLLAMGGAVALSLILILALGLQVRSRAVIAEEAGARGDLATAEAIIDLKYPGPWQIRGRELYKGQFSISSDTAAVDYVKALTGDECEIYANNICASTTLRAGECDRAVGAYAPHEVTRRYLDRGEIYTGRAEVAGKFYQTAYKPITDEGNQIIGVIYVGAPRVFHDAVLYNMFGVAGFVGLGLTLLTGLVARMSVGRTETGKASPAYDRMPRGASSPVNAWTSKIDKASQQQIGRESGRQPKQEQAPAGKGEDGQEWLDNLFEPCQELPKGLNRLTLKQIGLFLKQQEGHDVTIQDVSRAVSLSKVTVRRYFDYLDGCGLLDVEQHYGSVGRPLRIFKLKA